MVAVVKGWRKGAPVNFNELAGFGKFLEVPPYGIVRNIDVLAQVSGQHFVMEVYLVEDISLPFSFKHPLVFAPK